MKKYMLTLYLQCGVVVEHEIEEDERITDMESTMAYVMDKGSDSVIHMKGLHIRMKSVIAFEINEIED